ncbi:NADase-type glycan-binding domain-containing protein [Streptomyces sp. NPDC014764]|uniref:NADase-type glycan-binding domain-containing protein n=1 Tax=Streptomyces sp. NPDC014764 TaxID=3364907 RepID=UPI0036FC2C97
MTSPSSGPGGRTASRCADCGTPAEPGQSFCDSCGAVLGWADGGGLAGRAERARTEPVRTEPVRTEPVRTEPARTESAAGTTEPAAPAAAASGGSAAGAYGAVGRPAEAAEASGATAANGPAGSAGASGGAGAVPAGGSRAAGMDGEAGTGSPAGASRTDGAASAAAGGRDPASTAVPPDDRDRATDAEDDTEPLPAVPSTATEPPRAQGSADTDAAERARSLLVPVADSERREGPEDPDVAPVLPGRTAARRPQVRTVGPQADAEGGVPCPWCSTPNRPERHFCARCAMSMARDEDAPQRLPWWRRMFADRTAEAAWAGERPRLHRGFGRVWNWVVGAVVIGLVVALVMNLGTMIQATRDHFAKRAPVGPSAVKASRSYTGHGAGLAFDKLNNTWWGPGIAQAAEGEWLEVTFDQPTRLLDLVITPGTSTRADQLSESALPRRIDAQITLADGEKITRTLTLDQSAGGQRRSFRVGEVTTVRFVLRSAYDVGPKKQVAIAEIEFFGPSHNNS